MKQLVEDLLTLSRIESTALVAKESEIIPVGPVIMEVVKEMGAVHEHQSARHPHTN